LLVKVGWYSEKYADRGVGKLQARKGNRQMRYGSACANTINGGVLKSMRPVFWTDLVGQSSNENKGIFYLLFHLILLADSLSTLFITPAFIVYEGDTVNC